MGARPRQRTLRAAAVPLCAEGLCRLRLPPRSRYPPSPPVACASPPPCGRRHTQRAVVCAPVGCAAHSPLAPHARARGRAGELDHRVPGEGVDGRGGAQQRRRGRQRSHRGRRPGRAPAERRQRQRQRRPAAVPVRRHRRPRRRRHHDLAAGEPAHADAAGAGGRQGGRGGARRRDGARRDADPRAGRARRQRRVHRRRALHARRPQGGAARRGALPSHRCRCVPRQAPSGRSQPGRCHRR